MSSMILVLTALAAALSVFPAALFARNWRLYRPAPRPGAGRIPGVSILIPARNEEQGIAAAVNAALASRGVEQVIVLDDGSTDQTARIVREIALRDSRLRLAGAPPLPAGWCGKQHACHVLSTLATNDVLAFIDADVRLEPNAMARAVAFMDAAGADLASGIPRQQTGTFLEKLLIPLIHFVLLGYLPMGRMRESANPAYGAGCGQLFVARRSAYQQAGGHAAIRRSLHDGIMLPRAFRRAGLLTDLFDATDVASCRMYRSAGEVWRGLQKNATEGMASPTAIVPWTIILFLGQVLPVALLVTWLVAGRAGHHAPALGLCVIAIVAAAGVRAAAAIRFRQSWLGALLHPIGVLVLLIVQWSALLQHLAGRPARWRGRDYAPAKPHGASGPASEPVLSGN